MARQTQPIITPKGPYPGVVSAGNLTFVFTAADVTNFDQFTLTGREMIVAINTHASSPFTFTLESVADDKGRLGDITAYSLAAGEYACFWAGNKTGWDQGGQFYLRASSVSVKFAVFRIPG